MNRPVRNRLLDALLPDVRENGWMPVAMLGYLAFLFVPLLSRVFPQVRWLDAPFHLGPTLLSIAVFVPLYFHVQREHARGRLAAVLGIYALALVLLPWNAYANTYVIYAASLLGLLPGNLARRLVMVVAMLGLFVWRAYGLWPLPVVAFMGALTTLISFSAFSAYHFEQARDRKQRELQLSQDEIRRIAAVAERERIGRDLHDLLGHTLSMIALKSELAGKLLERDPAGARREIEDVAEVSRRTLEQVRNAVSGMRMAVLEAELASAHALLQSADVQMTTEIGELPALPSAVENALAMTLREASTNIQRHAAARNVSVRLHREGDALAMRVQDDGRGGNMRPGTGLSGMRERIEALGGTLALDGRNGTTLDVRLPLETSA